jgi:prolyl-tRNA editing enzyme YbaK/EbsC (Cys-tRNA(Pro) deacylase)
VAGGPATPGTPSPQATVTGVVTDLDPVALTFTLRGTDGKTYVFLVSGTSQVDLVALANNLFAQQQITVTYRGMTAPYEAVGVR